MSNMEHISNIFQFERKENNILETLDPETEYIKDGDIYCKKCNTQRTCFGITQKVRCICKCKAEEMKRKEEIEKQKEKQKRVEKLRCNSLLGDKYKQVKFENTDVTDEQFQKVFNRCKKYCEVADVVLNRGIGIYLYGTKGTGKTRLTACMANEMMNEYYSVLFTNFSEISKYIRSTFGKTNASEYDFIEKLANIDFLFIDDFGTEMVNRNDQDLWLQEKIFDVINKRYNNNKPIIFTSNYSLIDLIQQRGVADKTIDRINEMCEIMKLEGRSYRAKVKATREVPF